MTSMAGTLLLRDRELIHQLLDDTNILEHEFAEGIPKPSAARAVFSPILRRWIVAGLFFNAQKLILPKSRGIFDYDRLLDRLVQIWRIRVLDGIAQLRNDWS